MRRRDIKIIHLVGQLGVGGAEMMLMNILRYRVKHGLKGYDFVQCTKGPEHFEEEINELGCTAYHTTIRSEGFFKRLFELYKIFSRYDVVHIHTQNAALQFFDVITAKLAGVSKIIVHCHNTSDWRSQKMNKLHKLFRWPLYILADEHLACGDDAGKWMFGNRKYKIIPLPIDCNKYRVQKAASGGKHIIHVGRFDEVKNHKLIFEIFREYLKIEKDATLTLLGDGMLRQSLLSENADLGNKVKSPGNVKDVSEYLKAQDVFIFPQKYEGFPTVLLEAQAAGLKCFVSDRVTQDINITGTIEFLQIDRPASEWANAIKEYTKSNSSIDTLECNRMIKRDYDIQKVNVKLQYIWNDI